MPYAKTVILIRHGQTPSNLTGSIQGPDEPLTDLGRDQAEKLANRLARSPRLYPLKAILTSSFARAKETALIIGDRFPGVAVVPSMVYHECLHPSRIRGLPINDPEVVRTLGEFTKNFHNPEYSYEDGETFSQRKARALIALSQLEDHYGDCIALVTHGVFATHIINCILHGEQLTSYMLERAPMMFPNTGILKLTFGEYHTFSGKRTGWRIHPGDASHLE
ncbi:MAG TPA: histidine phosphatase family protein [Candidatus Paceibacterota bacterium]|nr:histidine phosphatase family protein [Candidatus Paceibacterota bacterium]